MGLERHVGEQGFSELPISKVYPRTAVDMRRVCPQIQDRHRSAESGGKSNEPPSSNGDGVGRLENRLTDNGADGALCALLF